MIISFKDLRHRLQEKLSGLICFLSGDFFSKKSIIKSTVFLLMILLSGYAIGQTIGIKIIKGIIKGDRSAFLLYKLPFEYIKTANLLSSPDELDRLEGYYSLLDNKLNDDELLIERFREESSLVKSTIVWLLGYSGNKDKTLEFLSQEYSSANQRVKREILKTMKRLDETFLKSFAKARNINIKEI